MATEKIKILYVDDESTLVELAVLTLERIGCIATGKTGGRAALEEIEKNGSSYDLVISDQTMPQMNGLELGRAIKGLYPHLPIIICTGFNASIDPAEAEALGVSSILMKPLCVEELVEAVKSALGLTGDLFQSFLEKNNP